MIITVHQGPYEDLPAAMAEASAKGAGLVLTAEMITSGYAIGAAAVAERAEAPDGPVAQDLAELAREHGVALAYGYPERDGDTVYNSVQLLSAQGEQLANYRKTHLFGELDHSQFSPGRELVVQARLDGLRVGLLICYDVEFPEAVRAHALSGTQLLLVPTALMRPYELIAETLVPARAYESQLYVAYANRCDTEGELAYCGLSTVVAPTGAVLAKAGDGPALISAEVDVATLESSRAENTHLADRRPGLYRSLTEGPRA
ncbi:carbon-nitrogen hydrolase family protein [Amycolatopsis sp. PS_44_ISF1]|uniref:carbon-nitrogen hydrolase family protein n=1 Tax=Amycolatopsis sp. PS_44_ISF1 TaxID=2974917 RepID=UPI0028DF2100|nr:carbon-nitrogen hydrolase family protein [Amycolatopsis sp. PS_44_ISF1]MDT8912192.1 carbon-nitrogen hydrolase family protein [Amycolatopsis sp. PS_44_ISF1]